MLPYPSRRTPPAAGPMPLKLGWAYREVALFGMPMWGYPEGGLVTYLEMPQGIQVALVDRSGRRRSTASPALTIRASLSPGTGSSGAGSRWRCCSPGCGSACGRRGARKSALMPRGR